MKRKAISFALAAVTLMGCYRENAAPDVNPYQLVRPDHFPDIKYPVENNPPTKAGFELGKKLFNDPRLSLDNSVACSNCHVKGVAFTDPQHNPSVGVFDRKGIRNAPSIANMAFQQEFMWDGGVSHLDFTSILAIENELEMAEDLGHVVFKLNHTPPYPTLFRDAFPDLDTITAPFLLQAISQYILLLVSDQSRYDMAVRGEIQLDPKEREGEELFRQKCAGCHAGSLFTSQEFLNNGLDSVFDDIGRYQISETPEDLGKFKVPSLRNIALTSPYMHDGRFQTLEEVLEHYRSGVRLSPTLAPELVRNGQTGIPMTDTEMARIIDFLQTLTDYAFISNPLL